MELENGPLMRTWANSPLDDLLLNNKTGMYMSIQCVPNKLLPRTIRNTCTWLPVISHTLCTSLQELRDSFIYVTYNLLTCT